MEKKSHLARKPDIPPCYLPYLRLQYVPKIRHESAPLPICHTRDNPPPAAPVIDHPASIVRPGRANNLEAVGGEGNLPTLPSLSTLVEGRSSQPPFSDRCSDIPAPVRLSSKQTTKRARLALPTTPKKEPATSGQVRC